MADTLSPAVPDEAEALAQEVLQRACDADVLLVTAESCTGGLLASLLTDVSGVSHAFDRGFVTYTNAAKHQMLGVPEDVLDDPGPVSEVVARAMAEGALAHSDGHIGLSVTGFAGPAGPGDEPGLVYFALARKDGPTLHREEHFGTDDRGEVRRRCLLTSLEMLKAALP
jgi:nicotinamide-nucleotide amidase